MWPLHCSWCSLLDLAIHRSRGAEPAVLTDRGKFLEEPGRGNRRWGESIVPDAPHDFPRRFVGLLQFLLGPLGQRKAGPPHVFWQVNVTNLHTTARIEPADE